MPTNVMGNNNIFDISILFLPEPACYDDAIDILDARPARRHMKRHTIIDDLSFLTPAHTNEE